jgi:CRISPR-associated protein Csa3
LLDILVGHHVSTRAIIHWDNKRSPKMGRFQFRATKIGHTSIAQSCNSTILMSPTVSGVMRTYLSAIGFNSTSVTRPLLSHGIDTGDQIVLIRPDQEPDSRAEEAIADVERLLQEIEPNIQLTTERITHDEFETAVLECSDLIRAAEGERIVSLGGGARDVLLPFVIAATTHVQLLSTALFFSDLDGTVREWSLPRLTAGVQDTTQATLQAIAATDGNISVPELTERTGHSKSTVTRHVNALADAGIIETWTEGKTKFASVTLTGQLLLRDTDTGV